MSSNRQHQFLSAAYKVLSKARRSMHYTQIAAVSQRLDILPSGGASVNISMSSLLSDDIRTNPDSLFVKERPGVYALSNKGLVASPPIEASPPNSTSLIHQLGSKTRITEPNALLNKALYLTGRTLDLAGSHGSLLYRTFDHKDSIKINVPDLVEEFSSQSVQVDMTLINDLSQATLRKLKHLACRLALDNPALALHFSLFLLDLAADLIGVHNVLEIESSTSSTRVLIRSGRQHA